MAPFDGGNLGNPSNHARLGSVKPMVTVHVPEVLVGGIEADWSAEWENGTGPYTISWDFGGGAANIGPQAAESPDEQTVAMLNDSHTDSAGYVYAVTIEDSYGLVGMASGEYAVAGSAPGRNGQRSRGAAGLA